MKIIDKHNIKNVIDDTYLLNLIPLKTISIEELKETFDQLLSLDHNIKLLAKEFLINSDLSDIPVTRFLIFKYFNKANLVKTRGVLSKKELRENKIIQMGLNKLNTYGTPFSTVRQFCDFVKKDIIESSGISEKDFDSAIYLVTKYYDLHLRDRNSILKLDIKRPHFQQAGDNDQTQTPSIESFLL
jgi:hypothetical protein